MSISTHCVVVFQGILVDTLTGELLLPLEKLRRLQYNITEHKYTAHDESWSAFLGTSVMPQV